MRGIEDQSSYDFSVTLLKDRNRGPRLYFLLEKHSFMTGPGDRSSYSYSRCRGPLVLS